MFLKEARSNEFEERIKFEEDICLRTYPHFN